MAPGPLSPIHPTSQTGKGTPKVQVPGGTAVRAGGIRLAGFRRRYPQSMSTGRYGGSAGWRFSADGGVQYPLPPPTRGPGPRNPRTVKGQNDHHEYLSKVMLEPVVGESPKPIDCWCSLSLAVERVFWKPLTAAPSRTTPPHPPQIMKRLAQKWRMQAQWLTPYAAQDAIRRKSPPGGSASRYCAASQVT